MVLTFPIWENCVLGHQREEPYGDALWIKRDADRSPGVISEVRSIVEAFPGTVPLEIQYSDGNGLRATLRSRSLTLAVSTTAMSELRSLLGDDSVRLQRGSK